MRFKVHLAPNQIWPEKAQVVLKLRLDVCMLVLLCDGWKTVARRAISPYW